MAYGASTVIEASTAKTATGNGTTVLVAEAGTKINIIVNVAAVAGTTPTLDVKVQWSHDGGATWADADTPDSFTQITAAKTVIKSFDRKAPSYRLVWTIGGTTPSFTFNASAYVSAS